MLAVFPMVTFVVVMVMLISLITFMAVTGVVVSVMLMAAALFMRAAVTVMRSSNS